MRHHWPEDKRNSEQEGSQVKQRKGTSIALGNDLKSNHRLEILSC